MTRIRPCIDLHEGQVKQIVGSSLRTDASSAVGSSSVGDGGGSTTNTTAQVNFASDRPPSYFSEVYRQDGLTGGHVILLGSTDANVKAAKDALGAWPGGWQVGGGITARNCQKWLEAGAGKIIVTSYLFEGAVLQYGRLEELVQLIGKEKLVIDLSCRRRSADDPNYYVVTNKWQTFTDTPVTKETLKRLSGYCDEFLVHAVDVEGKQAGIQKDLVEFLGEHSPIPVTYAGGVRNLDDLDLVETLGCGRVDVTVGSALDIFGGSLAYQDVVNWHKARNPSIK
jgi:phosphoribosylformimino-5-aminoimidazole carboxamide ribotide isomerase